MQKLKVTLLFVFFLAPFIIQAQFTVTGKVIGQNNVPIPAAEISLLTTTNTLVVSQLTDEEGNFKLSAFQGSYLLQVKQLGAIFIEKNINVTQNLNLGMLQPEGAKKLEEVTIVAKKKLIERKVDRLVFNVENSIIATGGDAIDALKSTPGIRVNNNITIIGRSNVAVLINDKIVQFSGEDLINFLKNIKSEDLKKIEVITNPPAKYDAQGNTGLINIITKTAKPNTMSGSLKTTLSQSSKSIGSLGSSFNYQKNNFTLSTNLNYSNGSSVPYQNYELEYPLYRWLEENNKEVFTNNLSGKLGLDFKISTTTKIGFEYSHSNNRPLIKSSNNSKIINRNTLITDSIINNIARIEMRKKNNSFNFYIISDLNEKGRKLTFDFDYLRYDSSTNNVFESKSYIGNTTSFLNKYFTARNQSFQAIDILTSKIDFEFPEKWAKMNFGSKFSYINNNSDLIFYNYSNTVYQLDLSKSNSFQYNESIQALYFSINKTFFEKLETQIGLRAENTLTKGYSKTLDQITDRNYFNLFPSVSINYTLNNDKSISINYNRRIDRPSYGDLNPFKFYSTSYNYSEGNPFLKSYFTDNIELAYTYKNLYSSIYWNHITNGFNEVTYVEPNSIIQKVIPNNFFDQSDIGFLQSYSFKFKNIESSNDASLFYSETKSQIKDIVPSISSWSGSFNSQNSIVLDKGKRYKAEFSFIYQTPSLAGSYSLSSYYQFDIGLKANFLSKKLQFSINAIDIFKTNQQVFTQMVNTIAQKNYDYADIRRIKFSIIYSLGKKLQIISKENSNKDEKNRIN